MEFAPADAITARFGGEEFIMFLPDDDAARDATTANDIRESVAREVNRQIGLSRPLTASFGLSAVKPGDAAIQDAIARADEALYETKKQGRRRGCVRQIGRAHACNQVT